MSIPKILHFGLFGGWKPTDLERKCMATWEKILPDYQFLEWNDENGPHSSRFFRDAIRARPVNASNYARLWALYEYGGVYLDNDFELLRPPELDHEAFIGFQRDDTEQDCINTAAMGCVPGNAFVKRLRDRLEKAEPDVWPVWAACTLPTEELYRAGMQGLNVEQTVGGVKVYDKERFYPYFHDQVPSGVCDRTIAVHRWNKSWGEQP